MAFTDQSDFLSEQKKFSRVRTAFADKQNTITAALKSVQINQADLNILPTL
jgi:hypothetical protein